MAKLMYEGVRIGGSRYFYNWYRWGYGWPITRTYEPLTSAEWRQVQKRWREFASNRHTSCAANEPPLQALESAVSD